jgi:hypothetical protein
MSREYCAPGLLGPLTQVEEPVVPTKPHLESTPCHARQPVVYWRAVTIAAVVSVLAVTGLIVALALTARQRSEKETASAPPLESARPATEPTTAPAAIPDRPVPQEAFPVTQTLAAAPRPQPELSDLFLATSGPARACETYGTKVQFLSNPVDAARRARHEDRLVFLLHVSGNFEDARFT